MQPTAAVAGSGPNGLAAAIRLAQAGVKIVVHEAAASVGGATRSAQLTLPGFLHDLGSAVHPLAVSSPFFATLPLAGHGLHWSWPEAALAHPLDDGTAILLERSLHATASQFGSDAAAYRKLFEPLAREWPALTSELLRPLRFPRRPLLLARFGIRALQPCTLLARSLFKGSRAQVFFAGLCAHSTLALESPLTSAYGMILGAAGHAVGWPIPIGGSQSIANALSSLLVSLGGVIRTASHVDSVPIQNTNLTLCDVTPRQLLEMARDRLPASFRRSLAAYRYGPGVFKMDWALSQPIPWKAKECLRAGTVHLGGSLNEIAASERAAWQGRPPEIPFVLLAQPSLFDTTRAPQGKHTVWAYCHVPNSWDGSAVTQIEAQIERFAPGFQECILARAVHATAQMTAWNQNLIGGDINGGAANLMQFIFRPTRYRYATPLKGLYLCSSSTPPGGGVHGMCGYWAATMALDRMARSD